MENKVMAVVKGKEITEKDLEMGIARLPYDRQQYFTSEEGKKQLLDQMISFELIYNYALDSGLENSKEFVEQLELVKKDLLIQAGVKAIMSEVDVTDEEAEEFYNSNKEMFKDGETVTARHILVDSEEEANNIATEIRDGKSFEDAAKEYSKCPSSSQGGSLGAFTRGRMVPEFENAAFKLEIGELSNAVKTQFGYHLIKVDSKQDADIKKFEEVKEELKGNLLHEKQNNKYMSFTETLKTKYPVEMTK